ncbi:hypothetical protein LSTR_LSTR000805 [Laodelphax striatellus]|uniref:Uncharacterized protein n=1 Tax=Laodelphax striatellus TaxID=195883 RepID=A0A482XGD7_LAOST|nr:hypothetical protein LSTR_LSTR017417 [Laodelphax striatellus]RZF44853.1 hypothetical protein LSTR_LSTR000805 [Laodelphax striatellus]
MCRCLLLPHLVGSHFRSHSMAKAASTPTPHHPSIIVLSIIHGTITIQSRRIASPAMPSGVSTQGRPAPFNLKQWLPDNFLEWLPIPISVQS